MPIGLIAGNGTFPFLVLRAARKLGHDVAVVAISGEAFPELEQLAQEVGRTSFVWVDLGALGKCIAALKEAGLSFRNEMETGPGGRQIQIEDPDGNPIELFEPAQR